MSDVTAHAPGFFCFAELAAGSKASAAEFYGGLFGWEAVGVPPVPDAGYFLLKLGGRDVAGMYELGPAQREQGLVPSWLAYVGVSNADASAERVRNLGGTLLAEPFDVGGIGRMCLATDPQGARFALWQPTGHIGYSRVGDPGCVCWNELATDDPEGAAAFYAGLFGWVADTKPMSSGTYTEWKHGKSVAGGMLEIAPEWGAMPPQWTVYFAVDDCDVSASLASALAGKVQVAPDDVPNVGRLAVLEDPDGATFSIFTPRLTA
jgi:predicted enzyme related to lactoylglutathione lyase